MNLHTSKRTAQQWIQVMPADLREMFEQNKKRTEFEDNSDNHTFRSFIDQSLNWSRTKQGHYFWETISQLDSFDNWQEKAPKSGFANLNAMPADLREMYFEELVHYNPHDYAGIAEDFENGGQKHPIFNNCETHYDFIGAHFDFDASIYGRDFWREIRTTNDRDKIAELTAIQFAPVTLHDNTTAPRKFVVCLSPYDYNINTYALKTDCEKIGNKYFLKSDIVKVYNSSNDLVKTHRNKVEDNRSYIKIGENYANVEIAHLHGYGKNTRGHFQPINTAEFCSLRGQNTYEKISDLPANYIFVNAYKNGYKIYFPETNADIYKCEVLGLIYCEEYTTCNTYIFVNEAGEERIIKISHNAQISPFFTIESQLFNTTRVTDENGWSVQYFSPESARNAGIEISRCPYCGNNESQHHDRERCKIDHFKNERYGYHSRKPRSVSSKAEFKIGVEIEKESFEGASHDCAAIYRAKGWVKESDGSLDSRIGYELVSPAFSLFGRNLMKEAEDLESRFPMLINGETSSACGGHIHFSKANTSGRDTLEMYCGYLPLLYAIYKGRTKQNYCKGIEKEEMKYSRDKYQAVRVLDERIEFRIFPAVKNLKTLQWRIDLLRYIAKHPTANPAQVVNDLCDKRTKLHALFLQIFSEQTIYKRALDTLTMAQRYDRNYYNIDFSNERKAIENKASKAGK